jgi:hypothetical protein
VEYWEGVALHVPILAKLAIVIFGLAPSEACVERSFSHQGLLHSDLRGSLDDSSIKALMSVRMNLSHFFSVSSAVKEEQK